MENISNCSYAMHHSGIEKQEEKPINNKDWTDDAANAVSKAFNGVEDFSTLFEED